jgi:DNA-binding response OmpR family regulator
MVSHKASPQPQRASPEREPTPEPRYPRRLALVADDEPLVRTLVATVLRNRGWSVIEAPDAATALAAAPETLDLLVTDYEMPAGSGLALAAQLRLRDDTLPVVMISGHQDVAARLATVNGPRTAFLLKPFPVEHLIATIGSITG